MYPEHAPMSLQEFSVLQERGRRRALDMIIHNPEARERVEKAFGIEYCKGRYPEAYGLNRPPVYDEPPQAQALQAVDSTTGLGF